MTMPAEAAAWIHDQVLPAAYRNARSDPAYCPCQWGPCGHCDAGRHNQCAVVGWGGAPRASCDTWITTARGHVVGTKGINAAVWRAGRPCRWVCPCGCTPIGCAPPPAVEPAYQLDLFALLNPNRSTT